MKLLTDYTVDKVPHSEHPSPQAKRDDFLCLNGEWDFYKIERDGNRSFEGKILVPFSPETLRSGIADGFVLQMGEKLSYTRKISLGKNLQKGITRLHFGAVDSACEVFVNGNRVGGHKGGFTAFYLDIQDFLIDSEAEIQVLVSDEGTRNGDARG